MYWGDNGISHIMQNERFIKDYSPGFCTNMQYKNIKITYINNNSTKKKKIKMNIYNTDLNHCRIGKWIKTIGDIETQCGRSLEKKDNVLYYVVF